MADITPKKRSRIISLAEHTEYTQRNIASLVGVSQKSVSRIIKQNEETGSFTPKRKGRCGRKRKTTPRDDAVIIRNSKLDPRKSSFELQKDLQHAGVEVSAITVRRRLLEVGRKARKPLKKQLLTKKMRQKRLAWARKYKNWSVEDWKKVLFSDETHFFVQGRHSKYVRVSEGERLSPLHFNQTVKHPPKKNVLGLFWIFWRWNINPN